MASHISIWSPIAGAASFVASMPTHFQRRMTGGAYRPEIDGLRFFAIATVVVGHACERAVRFFSSARDVAEDNWLLGLFQRGGIGVFLFFAISGFIIATQARKAKAPPLSGRFLKSYFLRRALRIEPPYIILLICTWAFLTLSGYTPPGTNHFFAEPQSLHLSLIGSIFYSHGLIWGAYPRLFPPGWSLEVEVQFYILAPLLFAVWFSLKNTRLRIVFAAIVLLLGGIFSLVTPAHWLGLSVDKSIIRFFHFFWLGILLADAQGWISKKVEHLGALPATALGWAGLLVYLTMPNAPDAVWPGILIRLATYAALVAMFTSAWALKSGFRKFCSLPWISLIGGACYSLYLVHMQTIQAISSLTTKWAPNLGLTGVAAMICFEIIAVIIAGLLFYIAIERPFMAPNWHREWPRRIRQRFFTRKPNQTSGAPAA